MTASGTDRVAFVSSDKWAAESPGYAKLSHQAFERRDRIRLLVKTLHPELFSNNANASTVEVLLPSDNTRGEGDNSGDCCTD
jgi:hypothetical protein